MFLASNVERKMTVLLDLAEYVIARLIVATLNHRTLINTEKMNAFDFTKYKIITKFITEIRIYYIYRFFLINKGVSQPPTSFS